MIYADWIEATGTQWIETGVPGDTPDLRTEIEYRPTAGYTSEYPVWGAIWEESGYFLMTYSNRWRFHIRGAVADDGSADTAYFSVISTTPNGFTVNGVQYSFGGSGEVSGNTITIFRIAHDPGTRANIYGRGRLHRFRIWSGNTLLHDYRAALNDSDVPGLYDTVTRTWLYNQGTGDFLYQIPYLYDKPSFLAGLAVGRMLWTPPDIPRHPPESRVFKQIYATQGYKIQWTGRRSCVLEWIAGGWPQIYDEGVVFQPGLGAITLIGNQNGNIWQWGICNPDGILPNIIHTGANRISYTNGTPNSTVQPSGNNSVFCGTAFGPAEGVVYRLTIAWEVNP